MIYPYKPLRVFAEYSLLFADKQVALPNQDKVDNGSMFRGHHLKGSIEHQLTTYMKHYVTAQVMLPGNYYSDQRSDTATWLRYAVELKW